MSVCVCVFLAVKVYHHCGLVSCFDSCLSKIPFSHADLPVMTLYTDTAIKILPVIASAIQTKPVNLHGNPLYTLKIAITLTFFSLKVFTLKEAYSTFDNIFNIFLIHLK